MKKALYMVSVLGLVGLISGTSLVLVYRYARPLIEENREKELRTAIFNIVPGAARYEKASERGEEFFKVYDNGGRLLGYAFIAEGNGYQGKIRLIAGVRKDLATLYGIEVLESVETPGLGGEIVSRAFKGQFASLEFMPEIECVKGKKEKPNEIEAITGATISSMSVANILNRKLAVVAGAIER
jgi:electron transport complex protein RnfG